MVSRFTVEKVLREFLFEPHDSDLERQIMRRLVEVVGRKPDVLEVSVEGVRVEYGDLEVSIETSPLEETGDSDEDDAQGSGGQDGASSPDEG